MGIGSNAEMDYIEVRQLALGKLEMLADVCRIPLRRLLRRAFSRNAVDVANPCRTDQMFLRHAVIALFVIRRNGSLIHPEQMHEFPIEAGLRHCLEHQFRRRSAGNRKGRVAVADQGRMEQMQYVPGACFGCRRGIGECVDVRRHWAPSIKRPSPRASSNLASRPTIASSWRRASPLSARGNTTI